jgi:hypothetical protein
MTVQKNYIHVWKTQIDREKQRKISWGVGDDWREDRDRDVGK